MLHPLWFLVFLVSISIAPAAAQSQRQAPRPCSAAEYRQFDFWLGEWTVTNAAGKEAGRNTITREHGGCVLVEHWRGSSGLTGSSFNMFVPDEKRWRQIWTDSSGLLLQLSGAIQNDGSIRMEGEGIAPGQRTLNRITWTPRPDGTVRQVWEISGDAGTTWKVAFDGLYKKHGDLPEA